MPTLVKSYALLFFEDDQTQPGAKCMAADRPAMPPPITTISKSSSGMAGIHRLKFLAECRDSARGDRNSGPLRLVETTVFSRLGILALPFRKLRDEAWTGNRFG
jgi:hypothetical protein